MNTALKHHTTPQSSSLLLQRDRLAMSLFTARRKPKRIARDEPEDKAAEVEEGMHFPNSTQDSAYPHSL